MDIICIKEIWWWGNWRIFLYLLQCIIEIYRVFRSLELFKNNNPVILNIRYTLMKNYVSLKKKQIIVLLCNNFYIIIITFKSLFIDVSMIYFQFSIFRKAKFYWKKENLISCTRLILFIENNSFDKVLYFLKHPVYSTHVSRTLTPFYKGSINYFVIITRNKILTTCHREKFN